MTEIASSTEITPSMAAALFPLGQVVATPGALDALNLAGILPAELLDRHAGGDWGVRRDK